MNPLPQIETDFRHVDTWIFDLDNTLYPASSGLFGQIDARMTQYVSNLMGVDATEARALQKAYYRDHGTTLNGLIEIHGIDPEAYLRFVHDIDLSALEPQTGLAAGLGRLNGRRCIFTNGCRDHAGRVLAHLGLSEHFDEIWDIRTTGFRPKHDRDAFRAILADRKIAANHAAMFDDIARNLIHPHEEGMTTIWLRNDSEWSKQGPQWPEASPSHVDYEIRELAPFLHSIRI